MSMVRPRLRGEQGGKCLRKAIFRLEFQNPLWKTSASGRRSQNSSRQSAIYGFPAFCRYNIAVPIIIRDAQLEDFETLWRIDQECFPTGISYSRQELKFYMRRRGSFTLAAEDTAADRIVGFIVVHDGPAGHVITIDVIWPMRRSGVGSLLLEAAEDRLRSAGSLTVDLETAVDNVSALSFYKRHAYDVIRTWPRYYSNGVDALVLRKDLKKSTAKDRKQEPGTDAGTAS